MQEPPSPNADLTWLEICLEAHRRSQETFPVEPCLRAFSGPHPRGGPPPPPERRWPKGFTQLEREILQPEGLSGIAGALQGEVDDNQAHLFARRLASVDQLLAARTGVSARVLRVGFRERLRNMLAAPRPRAIRLRALADFYYSQTARLDHSRNPRLAELPHLALLARELDWVQAMPGIEHAKISGQTREGPQHINCLRVDPHRIELRIGHAAPTAPKQHSFPDQLHALGAVGGVSGGFFLYSEPDIEPPSRRFDPVGLLVSGGRLLAPACFHRSALLLGPTGQTDMDGLGPVHLKFIVGDREMRGHGAINRAQAPYGPNAPSIAVVGARITACGHQLAVPLNGLVIPTPHATHLRKGQSGTWVIDDDRRTWPVQEALAGGPRLLRDGQVDIDLRREDFWGSAPPVTFSQDETEDENLLARLTVGRTTAGALIFAAIDGRNIERAFGLTLHQSAELMRELGCYEAMNLDGGASKRMVLEGRTLDLANTEVATTTSGPARLRPVHSWISLHPRA